MLVRRRTPFRPLPPRFFGVPALTATAALVLLAAPVVRADALSGKVVGPDGKSVAGASVRVRIFKPTPTGAPGWGDTRATTGADGTFKTEDLKPYVGAKAADGSPLLGIVTVVPPSGSGLALRGNLFLGAGGGDGKPGEANTVRLNKGVSVRGKVVGADNKPAAGVRLRLSSVYMGGGRGSGDSYLSVRDIGATAPDADHYTARSGADGAWKIEGLPAEGVEATVEVDDPALVRSRLRVPLDGQGGGGTADKPFTVRPGGVLTGRVVGRDGMVRPSVRVFARAVNFGEGWADALTGPDGVYRLTGLPSGAFDVWIEAASGPDGRPPAEVAAPLAAVTVTAGKTAAAPADLVMSAGGLIEVRVVDAEDGKPVANLHLGAEPDGAGVRGTGGGAASDAAGIVRLRVPAGAYRVAAYGAPPTHRAPDRDAPPPTVTVAEGATRTVTLKLPRALGLTGVARDAAGKPVAGAKLTVIQQPMREPVVTDAEGRFTIPGVDPGKVRLVASGGWAVVYTGEERQQGWNVPAKEPVAVTLRPFNDAPTAGRVSDPLGKPVEGITVTVQSRMVMGGGGYWIDVRETKTGPDGRYTLPALRPETPPERLSFAKNGHAFVKGGELSDAPDGSGYRVADAVVRTLDAGRRLRGRVVDASGKPVAGARVVALGAETGGETRTDAAGTFTLIGLPEGDGARVLAAAGKWFGAAEVTATATAATIKLAPVAAFAPRPDDKARAAAILRAIQKRTAEAGGDWPIGGNVAWHAAARDPDLAMSLLEGRPGGGPSEEARASIVRRVAEEQPARLADWVPPRLSALVETETRRDAAYALATARLVGMSASPVAASLYEDLRAAPVPAERWRESRHYQRLAVLAARLNRPDEAQGWIKKLIAFAHEKGGGPEGKESRSILRSAAYEVAVGGAALVRPLLPLGTPEEKSDTYMRAICRLARRSAVDARSLLDEMAKDPAASGPRDDYNRSRATLEVVRELAKTDPASAAKLADRVTYRWFQAAALALAAHGHTSARAAAPLYNRAAAVADGPDALAEVAALALDNAPEVAARLLADARKKVGEIRFVGGDGDAFRDTTLVRVAYRLARVAPGEARQLLEEVRARHETRPDGWDAYGNARRDLAAAMAVLDPARALAWSESLPDRQKNGSFDIKNDAQIKIALMLLSDPAARRAAPLDRHSQYGFVESDY